MDLHRNGDFYGKRDKVNVIHIRECGAETAGRTGETD